MRPPISSTSLQQMARPETGAAVFAGPRAVDLLERQEDAFALLRRDSDPRVADREVQQHGGLSSRESTEIRTTTSPCSVNLIALPTRLTSTCRSRVGSPITRSGTAGSTRRTISSPRLWADTASDFRMPATESRRPNSTCSMSSLPASILEKSRMLLISDKQRLGRFLHDRQIIALLGVDRRVEQELGHAEDGVHRRADLVAHVGDKRALGPVGLVGRLFGRLELGFRLLLRRDIDHEAQAAVAAAPQHGQAVEHVHAAAVLADQLLFPRRRSRRSS